MNMTALDAIQGAYSMIGIFDQSSPLTPFETQLGLTTLQDLLDKWDNEALLVYSSTPYAFPFQNGIQTYQLGPVNQFTCNILGNVMTVLTGTPVIALGTSVLIAPGVAAGTIVESLVTGNQYLLNWTAPGPITGVQAGLCNPVAPNTNTFITGAQDYNWNIPRPVKIEKVSIQYPSGTNQPVEIEIPQIPLEEWVGIPQKNTQSLWPLLVYDDSAFPFRNLRFWPIPTAASSCILQVWEQLSALSSLTQNLYAPPGYAMAIKLTLAEYLALHFERALSPDFHAKALAARQAIDNINEGIPRTRYDPIWGGRSNDFTWASRGRVRI